MLRKFAAAITAVSIAGTAVQAGALQDDIPELATGAASSVVAAPEAPAKPRRHKLGSGVFFGNDFLGDNKDRWRTGSIGGSYVRGYDWTGVAPASFGDLIEYRFLAQAIAPDDLASFDPTDRPYAGAISFGVHSHVNRGGYEIALGGDLVFIGPQSGIDGLHKDLHHLFGSEQPSEAVLDNQISNTIRPTAVAEVGRSYDLGGMTTLRPFVEARAGDETLIRVGADLMIGPAGRGELLVRDPITGHRYRVIRAEQRGFSFTLGGDIAYVADSVYLPSSRGYDLSNHRDRLRAGVHWQGRRAGVFFGLAYLGEEFEAQSEGQTVGLMQIKLTF
ncbi:lipid A-modifier LpxR family protein [Pseudodonghicola xiamenensis]|uniref:Outer membrane protein n=1 Tax=Pseudodonghicola xiamenensis TaxID=337702 RepID=A0A8J3H9T4_9RHOB|nr:lipid A-modifier LpxR family protein [Pseudodonghicola xiamenensis]GHG93436.1 hypothetical protein GCM10010961_25910 [Pseudodonghicola xiamenensis]